MKWELDDNARSGFHYLLLGVVVIGLPSLLISLIDLWQTVNVTADVHKLQVFRNGYLLRDPSWITATFSTRGERMATGVLLAIPCGLVLAGLLRMVGVRTHHWVIGRWATALLLLYFGYAAVAMPKRRCYLSGGQLVMTRNLGILLTDLPFPFTEKVDTVSFGTGQEVHCSVHEDRRTWRVFLRNGLREVEIATSKDDSSHVASGVAYLDRLLAAP